VLFGVWTKRSKEKARLYEYVNSKKLNCLFFGLDNISRGKSFFRFNSKKMLGFPDVFVLVKLLTHDFFPVLNLILIKPDKQHILFQKLEHFDLGTFVLDFIGLLSPEDIKMFVQALNRYVHYKKKERFEQHFTALLSKLLLLIDNKEGLKSLKITKPTCLQPLKQTMIW
jgi:hypothetical protein